MASAGLRPRNRIAFISREDGSLDSLLGTEPGEGAGRLVSLDDRLAALEELADLPSLPDPLAELPVAAPDAVAGGDKVTKAAQAVEGLPLGAEGAADPHHLRYGCES